MPRMNKMGSSSKIGQKQQQFLVICNFIPSSHQDAQLFPQLLANNPSTSNVHLLPIWIGDLVQISAQNGDWCFGQRMEEPDKLGLFPCSHIREMPTYSGRKEMAEVDQLAMEIGQAAKAWWECTKLGIESGESGTEDCEQQMLLIKQIMMVRRRLRYGTIPAEELRELRLTVANAIDAGNQAMRLPMSIRDEQGRPIRAEDLSVMNAYKRHEETSQRATAQQILEPSIVDKLAQSGSGPSEWALHISVEHSELARATGQNADLVFGLGRMMKPKEREQHSRATRPLTEPFTIRFQSNNGTNDGKPSRALFMGLTDTELRDTGHSLSIWMTALRMAPLGQGKSEEVRQFYAHGQADLGELVKEMTDKEQRELILILSRKICPLNESCPSANDHSIPNASSASFPFERLKIPVTLTVQLFAGSRDHLMATNSAELRLIPQLRKLQENGNFSRELLASEERRNEVFIWLRDGDFHGIGKAEKNIEAVASVVDDDGAFRPEAIEILTPDGPIRESSFRCRVWLAEDRPRFNEVIKVLLPEQEERNLHLQILFYNRPANDKSKSSTSSSTSKGPFALAFLRLLHNFVLCPDDEDELFIYRVEKGKGGGDLGKSLNVGYLTNLSKRKEMRQPAVGSGVQPSGRSPSVATLTKGLDLSQLQNGGMYTLCEKNGLHFQSFVCSQWHSNSQPLVQILRWRDNDQHLLRLRLLELSNIDLGELQKELSKFLPDLLDALFQIADAYVQLQRPAFDAIVQICRFIEESKQTDGGQFQAMLEDYIRHMPFPKAHFFLLEHINCYVSNDSIGADHLLKPSHNSPSTAAAPIPLLLQHRPSISGRDQLLPLLKSLGPLIRLALVSKCSSNFLHLIFAQSDLTNRPGQMEAQREHQLFIGQLNSLRSALLLLLSSPGRKLTSQNAALKHLPALIVPLLQHAIYEPIELANFVKEVLDSLSMGILLHQKLLFLGEIVNSELFANHECRRLLLDRFLAELLAQMPPHVRQEEQMRMTLQRRESVHSETAISANVHMEAVQLSATILANLLDRLFPYSRHSPVDQSGTGAELALILGKCLRPLNQTMITLLGDPAHQRTLHSLLLAILDKMSARHFSDYFTRMDRPLDRIDTLSEMLHMFRDLMVRCPVPLNWVQIRRLQCRLFLKNIRFAAGYVEKEFGPGDKFDPQLWSECMFSCMTFAKWAGEEEERRRGRRKGRAHCIEAEEENGKEMGQFAIKMLRSLWHSLSLEAKLQMMSEMVGPIMEVALCEDGQVQDLVMPIFLDMLVTELGLTTKSLAPSSSSIDGVVLRKTRHQEQMASDGNSRLDDEFINRLDMALDTIDNGHIFANFRQAFNRAFERQMLSKTAGVLGREANRIHIFVQRVNKLLELFSAYLSIAKSDGQLEMGLFCTVQLIDFYQSTGQNALYLVYLYKLYNLHISAGNWVEAALTLQRHANLLKWTNERPISWLYGANKQNNAFGSQLELKEHLFKEMADLFAKGGHWELAIEINKELANVYEDILFDYAKMAKLLERNAELYKNVIREIRFESNYFLVAFYGRDCPAYLANSKFIFRGEQLELWGAFKQRFLKNFSDFKFIDSMDDCDELMRDVVDKFVQIIAVLPIPSPAYNSLLQSPSRLASWYYKYHKVHRFELVRREFRNETKWTQLEDTESMRLWLHKKIIGIQRPLPDLLSFSPVISEQDQELMNPVEVAMEKVREANDKLADVTGRVSEGFGHFLMNLGGMVRGIVQADVGGGIKNYQAFFTAQCLDNCSEEEKRSIEQLKALILEQITLLEFALFIHANTEQVKANNAAFHNSLVDSFEHHRHRVENKLLGTTAKSILPEGASIYVVEQPTTTTCKPIGATSSSMAESRLSSHSASALMPLTSPNSVGGTKATRSQSTISDGQHHRFNNATSSSSQNLRPPSAASQSNSSGSSGSAAIFRNSPFGAASSLIRTTIQGKSKQKHRKNSKKIVDGGGVDMRHQPHCAANNCAGVPPSSSAAGHLLSNAFSRAARTSDASMENCFPMESGQLAPPLPTRLSNLHSDKQISRIDQK